MSRDAAPTTMTTGPAGVALPSVIGRRTGPHRVRTYTGRPSTFPSDSGVSVYFYELHEGDEEVFSDVLLATENEVDAEEFFELVQSIRRSVQDTYEDDTLIEAIAAELERDHEFVYVSDERVTAAVNVSVVEEENVPIHIH